MDTRRGLRGRRDAFVTSARRLVLLCAAAAGLHAQAQAPQVEPLRLDPGGFTVDFRNTGSTPVTGADMLVNGGMEATDAAGVAGWAKASYVWLPTPDPAREAQMHERLKPLMQWKSTQQDAYEGRCALHLSIPRLAYLESDPPGHEFCAYYRQAVVPPQSADDVTYVLSFRQRGQSASDVPNSRPYVRVSFYDSEDSGTQKPTRVYAQKIFVSDRSWRPGELRFTAPKATRCLMVRLALAGCGEVWFDRVRLHRARGQAGGPTARLMPWSYLHDLYCLSTGDAGVMVFGFRNESAAPIQRPHLVLELPEGIDILDMSDAARIVSAKPVDGLGRRQYRIDITRWKRRIRDGSFAYPHNMWEGLALLLRTARPAGDARLEARYWLEDGQYRMEPRSFAIQVVPPVPVGPRPERFRTGAVLFLVYRFATPEGVAALAKLYSQVGFNSVHIPPSALGAELGRLGIERYTQPFANGYTMGSRRPGDKPEQAVFRLADGRPVWEAICPVEVYTKGEYFRTAIVNDILRRILVTERQAEQIMANWEPFMYNGKGCFCDRCRREFESYAGLSAAEVKRVWPNAVLRRHGDLWRKFRSWQHGRLMVTLEETVNALGQDAGLDSHFIPEITRRLVTCGWDKHPANREYAAVDYLGKLPVLEPWGPYTWYIFTRGPYDYVRGLHLETHASACEVRRFLDARLPEGQRPRLIAFPYGTYEGATEPEALAFEILTYFVNGYHGAFAYLFPGGYDARYWRALAEANRLIARFDAFVGEGRAVRMHDIKPETPMPRPDPRFLSFAGGVGEIAERWKDARLLVSWEFERAGARLIAVGNFHERGECFFRLTPRGLDAGREYVLHEPAAQRAYADTRGRVALRGDDVQRGTLLHVGAMRYAFFVLEPYREGQSYGKTVRPQAMQAAAQARAQ